MAEKCTMPKDLPWMSSTPSNTKLEESGLFRWLLKMRGEQDAGGYIRLYRKAQKLFPYYLPEKYYNMNCTEHHLSGTDEETLWDHVTHLMLLVVRNRFSSWHSLGNYFHDSCCKEDKFYYYHKSEFKSFDMKNEVLCATPEKFLLEPWVLVQLPFNPVILHQWLVAALVEVLKFEKLTAEIFVVEFPVIHSSTVAELGRLIGDLRRNVAFGFQFLTRKREVQPVNSSLCEAIEELVPLLRFIMSSEASDAVNALKKILWSGKVSAKNCKLTSMTRNYPWLPENTIYDIGFWLSQNRPATLFGGQRGTPVKGIAYHQQAHHQSRNLGIYIHPLKEYLVSGVQSSKLTVQEFLCGEQIKQLVPLTLDVEETPAIEVKKASDVVWLEIFAFLEDFQLSSGVRPEDRSVIFNTISLSAEVEMISCACVLLKNFAKEKNIQLKSTIETKCIDLDDEKIKSTFVRVRQGDPEWMFNSILQKQAAQLRENTELQKSLGKFEFVYKLEVQVKQLALKMAQWCFSPAKEQKLQLLDMEEWYAIQFVLPCMVVSLANLHKDIDVEDVAKEWFHDFISALIATYEGENCFTFLNSKPKYPEIFFSDLEAPPYYREALVESWKMAKDRIPYDSVKDQLAGLDKFISVMSESFSGGMNVIFVWRLVWRIKYILNKILGNLEDLVENKMKNLLVTCRFLANSTFFADAEDFVWEVDLAAIAAEIFQGCSKQTEVVSFHRLRKVKPNLPANLNDVFKEELKRLSEQQIYGILFYLLIHYSIFEYFTLEELQSSIPLPTPFDPVHTAVFWFRHKNLWRFKRAISEWLVIDGVDKSMVDFDFAWEEAPVCYSIILQDVSRKKKIKMNHPGEVTFSPINHCRWCGLVKNEDFRICPLCKDDPDYKDRNIFCSEKCEQAALEAQHSEEHSKSMLIECGFSV